MTIHPTNPTVKAGISTFIMLAVVAGCHKNGEQQQSAMATDVPVSVTVVKKQKLESSLSLVGNVNPQADINVVSETQGTVTGIHMKVGSQVVPGSILAEVDDQIPRSTKAAAEINYQKAQRDYQRAEELFQENSISASQLDASRLAMKAAENQLDIARRQLENTRLRSRIAGTVNSRSVDIGTMVQPGMVVANIVDISALKVRVNVPERETFQLKVGDRVDITTDVYPGAVFVGSIDNIAAKADEAHTYPVEIVVPNNGKNPLKAGMFARLLFKSIAASDALVIPRIALIGSIKEARVFIVHGQQAYLTSFVVGKQSAGLFEVASGLSEGDTVVISGQNNLVDGTKVQVVSKQ
jgi:RND family efflux transporter MFP subunit